MFKDPNEEEGFGSTQFGKPVDQRSRLNLRFYLIVFLVTAFFPASYVGYSELYKNWLERQRPKIDVPHLPTGIGNAGLNFKMNVSDWGAGLDEVIVRSEQGKEVKEILRKKYPPGKLLRDSLSVDIPPPPNGLAEGDAAIYIVVIDRSYWKNLFQFSFIVRVDYQPPQVEILSKPDVFSSRGSGIVFFKVNDASSVISFVRSGENFFPAFHAGKLDPDLLPFRDLYFSLASVPTATQTRPERLKIIARDEAENITQAEISVTVTGSSTSDQRYDFNGKSAAEKISNLFQTAVTTDPAILDAFNAEDSFAKDSIRKLKFLNLNIRNSFEEKLRQIFQRPKTIRMFRQAFSRQPDSMLNSGFGDKINYFFDNSEVGTWNNAGTDLRLDPASEVGAANDGVVIFVGTAGALGLTVIIDHGFGVCSLYAYLDSSLVAEGDHVYKGQPIAQSGSSGLADSSILHYELRLSGIPVRPTEWWDPLWVKTNIDDRILEIKKQLGVKVMEALE